MPSNQLFSVLMCLIGFVAIGTIVNYTFLRRLREAHRSKELEYEYIPPPEASFEDEIKAAKMKPQKTIIYGQNYFAYDADKRLVLLRTYKCPEGILLDYSDIISYELIKDGETITRSGAGIIDRATMAGEEGIICSDLRLVIRTNKKNSPEVVLPLISFSIASEFAYKEALGAAREAAQAMEEIIEENRLRPNGV